MESFEKFEQIERGKRIRNIRENELHMSKTQLAKEIGISSQFLGLVENGRGNLVYKSLKKLRDLSSHSCDYILFGIENENQNNNNAVNIMLSELNEKEQLYAENLLLVYVEACKNVFR